MNITTMNNEQWRLRTVRIAYCGNLQLQHHNTRKFIIPHATNYQCKLLLFRPSFCCNLSLILPSCLNNCMCNAPSECLRERSEEESKRTS